MSKQAKVRTFPVWQAAVTRHECVSAVSRDIFEREGAFRREDIIRAGHVHGRGTSMCLYLISTMLLAAGT